MNKRLPDPKLTWEPPQMRLSRIAFEWSAPYAGVAHERAYLQNGGRIYPRRWTKYAIHYLINVADSFAGFYQKYGDLDIAFRQVALALNSAFLDALLAPVYTYPTVTVRQSGEVAGSPRDVYDLGGLYDSQSYRVE